MQLVTERTGSEHPELVLAGRFDAFETEKFRTAADQILDNGATDLSVDLSDVIFIDSSGLAELVRTMKHCRESGGDLTPHCYIARRLRRLYFLRGPANRR